MIKIQCKKCGKIGYSASHVTKCECGNDCLIIQQDKTAGGNIKNYARGIIIRPAW